MTLTIKAEIDFGNRGSFNPRCSNAPPWPYKLLTQVKMPIIEPPSDLTLGISCGAKRRQLHAVVMWHLLEDLKTHLDPPALTD